MFWGITVIPDGEGLEYVDQKTVRMCDGGMIPACRLGRMRCT